jgi:hypothetical protein
VTVASTSRYLIESETDTLVNEEDLADSDFSAMNSNGSSDDDGEDVHNISDRVSVITDMW